MSTQQLKSHRGLCDYHSSYCDYEWKRKTVWLPSSIGVIEKSKGGRNKWKWEAVETRLEWGWAVLTKC